ncbi:MAG TPA: hypothetical protein VL793_14475 [Patescibacteria group bacterium]|nr:hypothetical protein [Patescibacteria group bacterium]
MKPRPARLSFMVSGWLLLWLAVGCSERTDVADHNPPLVIEPNARVGPIKSGMAIQDVLKQLGEPNRRTANALEYTRLGFAIMPNSSGLVQVVMCGDVTGINGPLVRAFTGRTKEGIGLGSTRDELVKAYGEPSSIEKMRWGSESIRYDNLGITFTLEGGKVYHMIVRLTPQEADRSVTLEPAPSTTQR